MMEHSAVKVIIHARSETTRIFINPDYGRGIMCEYTSEEDFEKTVTTLTRHSSEWFQAHQDTEISLRFTLYVAESQSGSLRNYYARILDDSQECVIGVLPALANRLATEVSRVVQVPAFRLRPLLSMIVYWLIQFHADKRSSLPDRTEMQDIFNGILTNRVLTFHNQ